MKNIKWLWLSFAVMVLDQVSKAIIRHFMTQGQSLRILDQIFMLTYTQNTGAAFSLSLGNPSFNRVFFIIITFIAVGLILFLLHNSKDKWQNIGLSLVIGGALGNVIDRIFLGSVTDFLDCDFPDFIMPRWPIFNIADSSIVIAMFILAIYILFFEHRKNLPQA
ncbi:MAG TPA: signal peptidase II [Candidatus Cloacimonadota bacterium]|nr:signal peptidase II [Candidatus Cloacimonadota bacterium]HPT71019.1 signal peptidase II [Candidatus Cloacimonadota bacterium]